MGDKPDPYIAVYAPPQPYRVGSLVHLRWFGLLSPTFVNQILGIIAYDIFPCHALMVNK